MKYRSLSVFLIASVVFGCAEFDRSNQDQVTLPVIRSADLWPGEVTLQGKGAKASVKDKYIGFTETVVRKKYGTPNFGAVRTLGELGGELHVDLREKLNNKMDVRVKELSYRLPDRQKYFWLVRGSGREWVVFADLTSPLGVEF